MMSGNAPGRGPALLLGLTLACIATGAEAQVVVDLRGRVLDSVTNEPISEAIVRLPALRRYTLTATDGGFSLRDVPRGIQTIQVVHLAYGEQVVHVHASPDSMLVIRVAPQAIRLDPIAVYDWRRVMSAMNRAAYGRALRMSGTTGDPVFWSTWNREQILASGQPDASSFLSRGPPRISIRKCTGLAFAGIDQLCVGIPFDGMYTSGRRVPDLMFSSQSEPRFGSVLPGGSSANSIALLVLIDDRPVRLEDLPHYDMSAIHRVETYGYRGERGIRLYTEGYLHLVAAGLIVPHTAIAADAFEFYRAVGDTLGGGIRRHDDR